MTLRLQGKVRRHILAISAVAALSAASGQLPSLGSSDPSTGLVLGQRSAAAAEPLLPDLLPVRASDLSLQRTRDGERQLRFSARLANLGRGPVEVRPNNARPCPSAQRHASQIMYRDVDGNHFFNRSVDTRVSRQSAGCMLFHPAHDHWHFEATARYSIVEPDAQGSVTTRHRKMSFCLRDSEPVPASFGTFNQPQYYGDCSRDTPQGISRGWVDLYSSSLPGQALTLPRGMDNGVYCLRIRVDPSDQVRESDELNQTSNKAFKLRGSEIGPVQTSPCAD